MAQDHSRFALFIGNRGFFPASLLETARHELTEVLTRLGHEVLTLDPSATRHGAVENPREGERYARFLRENAGRFDGVILALPNFGDETGAVAALQDAGVPILVQAYPDELEKMAPAHRRDAFCGKFSVMDVFCQYGVRFTALKPHTVHPRTPRFAENVDTFDRICRVVRGMRRMVVGAVGARTTAFKTVRADELALQRHGITVETFDLSGVLARVAALPATDDRVRAKLDRLLGYTRWTGVPGEAQEKLARLAVVLDGLIEENGLHALALRCWVELQQQLGVSPCVLLGMLNDAGVTSACELDVGNAVTMHALAQASGRPATCLDWNNNYGDDEDRCILFHCGPVPQSLMAGPGQVTDHLILANSTGPGCGYGCNTGRIAPAPFTYGSLLTEDGKLKAYLGQGRFTADPIPADFFGCAGVAHIEGLQDKLLTIGAAGHRHHVSVTPGHHLAAVAEALTKYLRFEVTVL
jgi:L-fucose isomerase-like protein